MGQINGSQRAKELQTEARNRYGRAFMSTDGVIAASLSEPVCPACKPGCPHLVCAYKEEKEASRFWDYALLNAIRTMHGLDGLESFT